MLFNCKSPPCCTQDTSVLCDHVHCRYISVHICMCVWVWLSFCGHLALCFILLCCLWIVRVIHFVYVILYHHAIIQLHCMFYLPNSPCSTSNRRPFLHLKSFLWGGSRTSYKHNINIFTCSFQTCLFFKNCMHAFKNVYCFLLSCCSAPKLSYCGS